MASILKPLIRSIGKLSRLKVPKLWGSHLPALQPKPRKAVGTGHRGMALRDLTPENDFERADTSEENQAKWEQLGSNVGEAFVYEAYPIAVHSSNVSTIQYFIDEQKLFVSFHNGSAYLYSNVTEDEAIQLFRFPSKGDWVWSHLRVRGSATAHQKPFVRLK